MWNGNSPSSPPILGTSTLTILIGTSKPCPKKTTSTGNQPANREGGAPVIAANLPSLLQSFFTDRLLRQRQASPHTIAGYRDCFRLLLHFAKERLGKMPSKLQIEDLDEPFYWSFSRPPGKRPQEQCSHTKSRPASEPSTLSSSTWL